MLLPLGTGPGDVFGPVNVVIGFFAAETSARAFASVSFGAALLWVAPPAGIAVRETTASTSPATAVSGRSLERPRPAFRSYMRPPRVTGPAPGSPQPGTLVRENGPKQASRAGSTPLVAP